MLRPPTFSDHAFDRVKQRTKMTAYEVAEIIWKGGCVNLGEKPGIQKVHLLIYSMKDDAFFVAVQSSADGTVVTLWPLEYHENLAWKIDEDQREQARQAAQRMLEEPPPEEPEPAKELSPPMKPSTHVTLHLPDARGKYKERHFKRLGAEDIHPGCEYDLDYLLTPAELAELRQLVREHPYGEPTVSVKFGKRGAPTYVDIPPE